MMAKRTMRDKPKGPKGGQPWVSFRWGSRGGNFGHSAWQPQAASVAAAGRCRGAVPEPSHTPGDTKMCLSMETHQPMADGAPSQTSTIPYHTIPYHTIPYQTTPHHTTAYHTIPDHTRPYQTIPRTLPWLSSFCDRHRKHLQCHSHHPQTKRTSAHTIQRGGGVQAAFVWYQAAFFRFQANIFSIFSIFGQLHFSELLSMRLFSKSRIMLIERYTSHFVHHFRKYVYK